jgi:hypothetical protein
MRQEWSNSAPRLRRSLSLAVGRAHPAIETLSTIMRRPAMVFVIVGSVLLSACAASPGLDGPSPLIVPDVAVTPVGATQTFTVVNASVVQFTLRSAGRPWPECVQIDQNTVSGRTIRLTVTAVCDGLVYITADIGTGRPPLVAAMTTE